MLLSAKSANKKALLLACEKDLRQLGWDIHMIGGALFGCEALTGSDLEKFRALRERAWEVAKQLQTLH